MAQTDRTTGLVGNAGFKVPCKVATTAAIVLTGEQTIDGVACVTDDRVLVKDQADTTQNGIWVVDTGSWTRAQDADGTYDFVKGSLIHITDGSLNIGQIFKLTTANPVTIGSSLLVWLQALIANSSAISFLQSGVAAVVRSVLAKLREDVSVFDFMSETEIADVQARTLLVDVTVSTDAAVTYAKANKKRLRWPAGNYLRTLSLNGTFANDGNANFMMYGDGKGVTTVTGILTELYPIVDYTGNTRGELRDMTVISVGATSKATCAFLSAKPTAGGGLGNTVTVENCALQVPTTGNANAIIGAVFYNTDLSKCLNTECYGPAGATFGFTKPAGVLSKFAGASATTDSTRYDLTGSVFIGNASPPLEYTGGAELHVRSVYCALTGTGAAGCIVKVSSSSGTSGNSIIGTIRTENQSSAVGVAAIQLSASSRGSNLIGTLESDSTGAAFLIDAAKTLSTSKLHIQKANGKIFAGDRQVNDIELVTNCTDLGEIAAASYNLDISGAISAANAFAQCTNGVRVSFASLTYASMNTMLVAPTEVAHNLRPVGNFAMAGIGTTAYTGGSGEQLVYSQTIHGAALQAWNAGNISPPAAVYELLGTTAATAAVGGRIRVNLIQGAGNVDILDTGANLAAGAGNIRITVKPMCVGSTNSRCYAELLHTPNATLGVAGAFSKFTNTQATIVFNADFTVNIYVTNTGNSPYSFNTEHGGID